MINAESDKVEPDAATKDSLSRKTSESSTSSSDYVVVGENNKSSLTSPVLEYVVSENELEDAIAAHTIAENMMNSPSTPNVVGKSIFYDCLNDPSPENLSFEKSDGEAVRIRFNWIYFNFSVLSDAAATYEIEQEFKNDGNFTIFSNVLYLGSANIYLPKNEAEILRQINELNQSSGNAGVKVKISIPNCCDGQVV